MTGRTGKTGRTGEKRLAKNIARVVILLPDLPVIPHFSDLYKRSAD
jgi:hypothetical protein